MPVHLRRELRLKQNNKLLLITPGDPDGIGPEIVWKTLRSRESRGGLRLPRALSLVCVGARKPFDELGAKVTEISEADLSRPELVQSQFRKNAVLLLKAPLSAPKKLFLPGFQSGWAIQKAAELILAGKADGLVTGPISKERLQRGGFKYTGHTDFLADLCGGCNVTMMLANSKLRITLVTVHMSLARVPGAVSAPKLKQTIQHTVEFLHSIQIKFPHIAVAALNPHAGEGGLFGSEEKRVITPVLRALQKDARRRSYRLSGPLPADTLFANHIAAQTRDKYDAVVCMYHDQGLIPVKLLDFPRTVNVTLGLPFVRTSVDHGVAFDIAGQNKADPSSLRSAIELATQWVLPLKKSERKRVNYEL